MQTTHKTLQDRALELYLECGGRDIDAAIARDRNLLALHDREVEHVATLPFDQHYRWRVAPSLMLRAQKDLERQMNRRDELMALCTSHARCESPAARQVSQPAEQADEQADELLRQAENLEAVMTDVVARLAAEGIELGEDAEAILPEALLT